ncbi:MAG: glutaredoxin family protein [Candidatus Acidiferrales bacterium]
MSQIKVYLTSWCWDCRRARKFLKEHGIEFEGIDIDESPDAEDVVLRENEGRRKVPTFEVDGRYFACSPFNAASLTEELKLPPKE